MSLATDLAARIAALPALVNDDARLVARGRLVSLAFRLDIGETQYHLTVEHGRISALERGPILMRAWRFLVRGAEPGWQQFWQPMPPPPYHDLFALVKCAGFAIEGDLYPLMANLLYFKDVLAAPRRAGGIA
jgi:hypothetical protein